MSTGDAVSRVIHLENESSEPKKAQKSKKATPTSTPTSPSGAELSQAISDLSQGMQAEIDFLKKKLGKIPELEHQVAQLLLELEAAQDLAKKLEAENQRSREALGDLAAQFQKKLEETQAGMEDLRESLDEAHQRARFQGKKPRPGEWHWGHVVIGALFAGGFAGVGLAFNAGFQRQVVAVNLPQMAGAFLAGVLTYETARHAS